MEQAPSRIGTSDVAEKADVLQECSSSSAVTPNYLTPLDAGFHSSDAGAATSMYYSARSEWLSELRSKCKTDLEFGIESSKSHWTEVCAARAKSDDSDEQVPSSVVSASSHDSDDEVAARNRVAFEEMKKDPKWGPIFAKKPFELKIGAKIAEGGQAEIFEVIGTHNEDFKSIYYTWELQVVLKVFKKGFLLDDLKKSWPGALTLGFSYGEPIWGLYGASFHRNLCWVAGVRLMDDGRFAFIFVRYKGDLRKLIDEKMMTLEGCPPFNGRKTYEFIRDIARGMSELHELDILHNDLRAANVLVSAYITVVADFESSCGIMGMGFWRAPEVLLALKNGNRSKEPFTQKSDVYSFAMTCYEIITGRIPFENYDWRHYDIVSRGERPTFLDAFPCDVLHDLVRRCWHQDPKERPSFKEICDYLEENYHKRSFVWTEFDSKRKEWFLRNGIG